MVFSPKPGNRGSILLLLLLSIITVTVVIAFAFLRSMQMSRSVTLVQRKDDLARLAAEMGMQHAIAVCIDEYGMANEVRDNATLPAVSRIDSPSQTTFAALSPASGYKSRPIKSFDLGADGAFNNLFHFFYGDTRTVGFSSGDVIKPGYARWFEANRFGYSPNAPTYDPSTLDEYSADAPNPGVVASSFPPVDPFVRGDALTKAHISDNPLLLDAELRSVTTAEDARFRLRYAIDVQDMSGTLWLNTDMPWLDTADKADARAAYAESVYAVGRQFGGGRGDSLESVFLGYGAVGNSRFQNGQPIEWAERGGVPMWYRCPTKSGGRYLHCVQGSPFMNWNDPGGTWIGSSIVSFNDLGFAIQEDEDSWHAAGEVVWNEGRVRGDTIAQFKATPFDRPRGGATDNPWSVNALTIAPRTLEALVSAYMPPAVRAVAVTSETCKPYIQRVDTWGNISKSFESGSDAQSNPITWNIPSDAELSMPGMGPDLFTETFRPKSQQPFSFPTPPLRDYWHTPVGSPASPGSWRAEYDPVPDLRTNSERYPGELFFADPVKERFGQALTRWRWLEADGVTACNGVATNPRQVQTDPFNTAGFVAPSWASGTAYTNDDQVVYSGQHYACTKSHTAAATNTPSASVPDANKWKEYWSIAQAPSDPYPAKEGVDHLGRHIVFYKTDPGDLAAVPNSNRKYLSAYVTGSGNAVNWKSEMNPGLPMNPSIAGPGKDGRMTPYKGSTITLYTPNPATTVNTEVYPAGTWSLANKILAAKTHPSLRGGAPLGVTTPEGWSVSQTSAGSWGGSAQTVFPNSYYNRVSLAFFHAVGVAQIANLAWANRTDARTQAYYKNDDSSGVMYSTTADINTSFVRKGKAALKHATDPKTGDEWNPAATDFMTVEQIDRQFVANLGESFDQPGRRLPDDAVAERPPRFVHWRGWMNEDATPISFQTASSMGVAEYRVTNNLRSLRTPIDTTTGALLTASSADPQTGLNVPPHKLWLLDEWNLGGEASYVPGTSVDIKPTKVARARAKMMECVLNDWRLSFLGSEASYVASFHPKDFDGDGIVFCSGYLGGAAADVDCGLTCWKTADGSGNGPGTSGGLTPFSVTGCLTITRSHQFKIHVRGELYDNFLDRPVSEQYLESALLVDPDGNVTRGGTASGLEDSTLMMQRPIHNYYHGFLNRAYP